MNSKTFDMLKTNIRIKAVTALGAMSGADSTAFYTSTDVAERIIKESGGQVTAEENRKLKALVSGALSKSASGKMDSVYKSPNKIHPRIAGETSKTANGYRIGFPMTAPVDADTLKNAADAAELATNKSKMRDIVTSYINAANFHQLNDLLLEVITRQDDIQREMQQKINNLNKVSDQVQQLADSLKT